MTLRSAAEADVARVAALERELFGPDAWSTAQVREELLGERRRGWVCGEPVHGYVITALAGDVADLQRIGVSAGHRRSGVARALLEEAVAAATADGAARMLLEVAAGNTGARSFYGSAGFAEIARRRHYYTGGGDAVVLQLALT